MSVYIFSEGAALSSLDTNKLEIDDACYGICPEMDRRHIVVAVYLMYHLFPECYANTWGESLEPEEFKKDADQEAWRCVKRFPVPSSLPSHYWLIRLYCGVPSKKSPGHRLLRYPISYPDQSGWQIGAFDFPPHLAFLLARQEYILLTAPLEGDTVGFKRAFAATHWALEERLYTGYEVGGQPHARGVLDGRQGPVRVDKCRWQPEVVGRDGAVASGVSIPDLEPVRHWLKRREDEALATPKRQHLRVHMRRLRALKKGSWVRVRFDPQKRYENEVALVIKTPGGKAEYLNIRTGDGKRWEWPMVYLEPCGEEQGWLTTLHRVAVAVGKEKGMGVPP